MNHGFQFDREGHGPGFLVSRLQLCAGISAVRNCYKTPAGDRLYIITEWDRSTTLLLPEEY